MAGGAQAAESGRVTDFGAAPWCMPEFQRAFMLNISSRRPAAAISAVMGIPEAAVLPFLRHLREIGVAPREPVTAQEMDEVILRTACNHGRLNATACLLALADIGADVTLNAVVGRTGRLARAGAVMPDGRPLEAVRMSGALATSLKFRHERGIPVETKEEIAEQLRQRAAVVKRRYRRNGLLNKASMAAIKAPSLGGRRAPTRTTLTKPSKGTCLWVYRAGGESRWCGSPVVPGTCWCSAHRIPITPLPGTAPTP